MIYLQVGQWLGSAQQRFSIRVCVYTTPLGFCPLKRPWDSNPQRGSTPVAKSPGCSTGIHGLNSQCANECQTSLPNFSGGFGSSKCFSPISPTCFHSLSNSGAYLPPVLLGYTSQMQLLRVKEQGYGKGDQCGSVGTYHNEGTPTEISLFSIIDIPRHSHHIHPNRTQLFFPPPSLRRILNVGTPTHLPVGEENTTQGTSSEVLQPKEGMT